MALIFVLYFVLDSQEAHADILPMNSYVHYVPEDESGSVKFMYIIKILAHGS